MSDQRASFGDQPLDQYFSSVYTELKQVAHQRLRYERVGHTLNTTGLVHEVYLKLIRQNKQAYQDNRHFLAIASQAMRRILIDYARQQQAQKRGGALLKLTHDDSQLAVETHPEALLSLDEALNRLAELNQRQSKVIESWFFGGFSHEEIAHMLDISLSSVRRDWRLARLWLSKELKHDLSNPHPAL